MQKHLSISVLTSPFSTFADVGPTACGMPTWTVISTVANVALLLALGILLTPLSSNSRSLNTLLDSNDPGCQCSCPSTPAGVAAVDLPFTPTTDSNQAGLPGTAGTLSRASIERETGTGETCVTPAYPLTGPESDWYTLKIFPPPAPCTVRGFVIEQLDPDYNFRRAYTLGSLALEDKTFLLPFFRAVQDRSMATRKRRVLLDLGGNAFETSTLWFLKHYPLAFTEVHTFEVAQGMFKIPESAPVPNDLLEHLTNSSQVPGAESLKVPQRNLDSITLHEKYVGLMDSANGVNITRFMLEELGLTREDSVVVKMDIENSEWAVLNEWLSIPEMPLIVDELFVEVHYSHASMTTFGWMGFPNSRDKATELFQKLRATGFFVHAWP